MTCPANPPPPAGYRYLRGTVDAPVSQWAVDVLRQSATHPLFTTWSMTYGGRTLVARSEHHTWTYRGGSLVTGICIRGISIFEPVPGGDAVTTPIDPNAPDPDLVRLTADGGGWWMTFALGVASGLAVDWLLRKERWI